MTNDILQSLTNNIIFSMNEKKSLKELAKKITIIPKTIKISSVYLTGDKI